MNEVINQYQKYCSSFTIKYKNLPTENTNKFNGCFISVSNRLVYLHIDKCASTSVSSSLKKSFFIHMGDIPEDAIDNLLNQKRYRSFCIIRDPISRWISGVGEFMNRFSGSETYIIEQVKNKKYIFDMHTAPQHLSIDPYVSKMENVYLKLDQNLEYKINCLITGPDKIVLNKERSSNLITKVKCKKIFQNYVKDNLECFYELYKNDFVLYSKSI